MADAKTLTAPPLPPLTWDTYFWRGDDTFPAWAGFQERLGPYSSSSSDRPSTGRVKLSITPANGDDNNPSPPTPAQVAAYTFLKANDRAVAAAALDAIFEKYPEWRDQYGYDGEDFDEGEENPMPELTSPDDLRKLIGLGIVHILSIAKDGHAYFGLELGCTWDEEHGAGLLMHKTRVINAGDAADSFNTWPADDDGGKPITP
jgi:hypothetical protein